MAWLSLLLFSADMLTGTSYERTTARKKSLKSSARHDILFEALPQLFSSVVTTSMWHPKKFAEQAKLLTRDLPGATFENNAPRIIRCAWFQAECTPYARTDDRGAWIISWMSFLSNPDEKYPVLGRTKWDSFFLPRSL